MEQHANKLYRSNTDKVIGGVSGGLADYLGIDVVIIRIIFVLLALFGGGGVLIYIVMWIIIPQQTVSFISSDNSVKVETATDDIPKPAVINKQSNTALGAGVILIIIGLLFLADRLFPFYNITDFWPVILIVAGVIVIKPDLFKSSKKIES